MIVPPREFGKCSQKTRPPCPFKVYGRCTLVEFEGKATVCKYLRRNIDAAADATERSMMR